MVDLPPQVEEVKVMRLQPGDIIIATVPEKLSYETCVVVQEKLDKVFEGYKVILTTGISFEVAHRYPEQYDGGGADGSH